MRTIDELVIGQTVEALQKAQDNNFHCLLTASPAKYFFFDGDLLNTSISLKFELYLRGKLINHTPVERITIEKDILSYFDGYMEKSIQFKKLYVYDFPWISCDGFKAYEVFCFYKVVDWIKFTHIKDHDVMHLFIGDRTLYELHFYFSRIKETNKRKNGAVLSYLYEKEFDDPDLSMSQTNLMLKNIFKEYKFVSKIRKRPSGKLDPIPCEYELTHREKIKISFYEVETPPNINFKNSYIHEVINEDTKTLLDVESLSSSGDNTDSQEPL